MLKSADNYLIFCIINPTDSIHPYYILGILKVIFSKK